MSIRTSPPNRYRRCRDEPSELEGHMKIEYVLFGFGILFCLAGVGYLAAEYVRYLSEAGKLVSLLLTVAMFAFLSKYFEDIGW